MTGRVASTVPHPSLLAQVERLPASERAAARFALWRNAEALNADVHRRLAGRLQLVELFAGIGGLGSGLERALGAMTVLQAEQEPPRRAVLAAHFPLALQIGDVMELLSVPPPAPGDQLVVAGGFPCRGASRANIHGIIGMDNPQTGLWSVMAEVIRRWQPLLCIAENVVSLRSRGLSRVLRDLIDAGYDVCWGKLEASAFGAPHERARLFVVGIRRGVSPRALESLPPLSDWLPWASELPANDYRSKGKKVRVAALGDAVVPVCSYTVGKTAARLLSGWRPDVSKPARLSHPPTNGLVTVEGAWALKSSPHVPELRIAPQRWAVQDERFMSPTRKVYDLCSPPSIGRILDGSDTGDQVDLEMPGGDFNPFPVEWVREQLWPTLVSSDAKNLGGLGQFERNAPGLNSLVQLDEWVVEDSIQNLCAFGMLEGEEYGHRGIGPGFCEWLMGFPVGWTEPAAASHSRARRKVAA